MGCSVSKIEPGEAEAAGLRPVRRRIQEIKRFRRVRKGSISTAELLRPEDLETIADDESPDHEKEAAPATKVPETGSGWSAAASEEKAEAAEETNERGEEDGRKLGFAAEEKNEKEEEEDGRKLGSAEEKNERAEEDCRKLGSAAEEKNERAEEDGRKLGSAAEEKNERGEEDGRKLGSAAAEGEEELPGSPSLRFYFVAAVEDSDENSVKDEKLKENKTEISHEREASNESLITSGEELDINPSKKKKGKRFRVLTKAPTAVCDLLNVKNCYCNNIAASAAAAVVVRESPRLVTGNAA